ncbi:hypothetical protein FOPG_16605 [Fusarium oxysporum f. sp. conglutinans race 2 54008]|uniref:NACHT domain-containing protein n=3 Tax=Fusarium oxysporum f. sp. conglutinans TaxID=100902 RepID=A0A8H6LCL2_FUSOX|nr:hypothetical protein FOPG_16605 [Fusarium oxysporum f. sp. conglutinans race 2 54008]KAF6514186.1 hypothetical protein HZS61_006442 [Fusarium oxysporum f. sp. conglutinans]KAG6988686.1 putative ankyrin repeat protein L25 [Fusarium oxysporum f. sp. conglutinans]
MSISALASQCAQLLTQAQSSRALSLTLRLDLENILVRFKIWAGHVGVFASENASVDYRLRQDADITDVFLSMLTSLKTNLERAINPPLLEELGEEEPSSASLAPSTSGSSSSSLTLDSDAEEGQDSQMQNELDPGDPIQRVNDVVDRLYRLASVVRKPVSSTENSRVRDFIAKQISRGENHDLEDAEDQARRYMQARFAKAPEFLVDRLVAAVVFRRMKLRYRQRHQEKLRQGVESSFAPDASDANRPATCCYCMRMISKEETQEPRWTRHILKDIEPYVCLFEDCNREDILFTSAEEWLGHMQWQHTVVWNCQAPGHEQNIYGSERELKEHIQQDHPGSFTGSQLPHLVKQGALPAADTFAFLALSFNSTETAGQPAVLCPICHDFPPSSAETGQSSTEGLPDIQNHIMGHLESIALLSLPEKDHLDSAESNVKQSSDNSIAVMRDEVDPPPAVLDDEPLGTDAVSQIPDSDDSFDIDVFIPAALDHEVSWTHILRDGTQPRLPEPGQDPFLLKWQERIKASLIQSEGAGLAPRPGSHSEVEVQLQSRVRLTANETKDVMTTIQSDHHVTRLERWLPSPDYSTNAQLARGRRQPGTGTWLLDSPAFQEWKLGLRRHLWLYGLAGCGKTVLSTTILDNIQQTDTHTTLAFFFDVNDPKKQKLENLLRSLAIQLYDTGNEAARKLDSLFTSHDDGRRQPDTNALSACVDTMIQTAGKVFIIIDALDECTAREELLQWLKHVASRKAQLLVTGRPEVEFQSAIPRSFGKRNCVQLDKNAINADIRSYVMAELEQRPHFVDKKLSPSILEEIRDKIGDGADGMFRWAACQLESLARCLSPKDIKIALTSLPRDLNETYGRMVQSIPSEYKSSAIRLLQFLVYTKRPLTLAEAIEVLATQIDQEPRGFDVDGRLSLKADVLRYCPSLVIIAEVTNYAGTVEELHLAHFSVKEYLLEQAQFTLENASTAIAKTCLTYLTDIRGSHSTIRRDFPMARYAAEFWTDYVVLAETSEEIVRTTVSFLRDETTFQRWCRLYQADRKWDHEPGPPRASRLYYACLGGLSWVARDLVTEGADVNAQGGEYGNALQAASSEGYLEVVQLLLDKGADVNAQGGSYGNALQAASYMGNLEVIQLLLDEGADINTESGRYGNALQAASSEGYLEVVQLLLDRGADVNAQGGDYGNALQAASCSGNLEIVQLLLDKGADVNAQTLQAASRGGNPEIVQLLNLNGAKMMSRKRSSSTNLRE